MSYDGIFTHEMVKELNDLLLDGRVAKVQQPYKNEVVLLIRAKRKTHRLLLSAHPQYARAQLTEIEYMNPPSPPQFCMVMRKYLEGAHLEKIEQISNDRVIQFYFSHRNELGDIHQLVLIMEIMGRHSNVLLVEPNENRILDVIRHVPSSLNTYRTLLPGAPYVPAPSQDKADPFDFVQEELPELDDAVSAKVIQQTFQGIGKDTAEEIRYWMQQENLSLAEGVHTLINRLSDPSLSPVLTVENRKQFLTPIPYDSLTGEKIPLSTLSELCDRYYQTKAEKDRAHQQSGDLYRLVENLLQKDEEKLKKQEKEFSHTKQANEWRTKGEILTAFMHELSVGQSKAVLPDFYSEGKEIEILLNPRKTPSENAQSYFKRYQKLKSAAVHLSDQIAKTKEEINYLESVQTQLNLASPQDVEAIRQELIQEGYLKKKQKRKQVKNQKSLGPETFRSSDGTMILVGKNNLQNDELSLKTARKTDIWLHAKDIPGSHVVIRDADPSNETLSEAANLAAYFSKSRESSSVPVDTVPIKKLKKPNGAKPGFVIYEGQTTLFVTPDEGLVRHLKENASKKANEK